MIGPLPIGVCTWIFGHHDYPALADDVAALGLDGVELMTDVTRSDAKKLGTVFRDRGLEIYSMTPENVDLCHTDPRAREAAVGYYEQLVEFAAEAGSLAITCHEHVAREIHHTASRAQWDRLVDSCTRVAARGEELGIDVLFEPLNRALVCAVHTAEDALALLDAVGSPRLRVVLDTFHMHREQEDAGAAIRACGERLGLVQLAGADRRGLDSCELPALHGALQEIGFAGPLILECAGDLAGPSLATQAIDRRRLRGDLLDSVAMLNELQPRPGCRVVRGPSD